MSAGRLAAWSGHSPEAIHAAIWRSGFEDQAERVVLSADDSVRGCGMRLGYPLSTAPWVEARRVALESDLAVLALARQLSEAFRRLATHLACAPDESLSVDDDATYVGGAREAGLSAQHVGGAAGVRTGSIGKSNGLFHRLPASPHPMPPCSRGASCQGVGLIESLPR